MTKILAAALALCFAHATWADTIRVPQDYPNLRQAITAAATGDIVEVEDGVWSGPDNTGIDLTGRNITVRSRNGAADCIIDCGGSTYAFFFGSGSSSEGTVEGFTIRNGAGVQGGGIRITGGSPVISRCKFVNCNASAIGGAIFSQYARPTITDCQFEGCTAGTFGGGVYVLDSLPTGNPIIRRCQFTTCSTNAGEGGGLYLLETGATVESCTFRQNTTADFGGGASCHGGAATFQGCEFIDNAASVGGGLYNNGGSTTIDGCSFSGNTSDSFGGGMTNDGAATTVSGCDFIGNTSGQGGGGCASSSGSVASLTDCRFLNNTSNNGGAVFNLNNHAPISGCAFEGNHATNNGGAVFNSGSNPPIIACTMVNNTADNSGGAMRNNNSDPQLANTVCYDNAPGEIFDNSVSSTTARYSNIKGGWPGPGNIDAPPLLSAPDKGDFRPLPGSPLIDAADNTWLLPGTPLDIHGAPRFVDDPKTADTGNPGGEGGTDIADIGAAEFQGLCRVDLTGDGLVDTLDFLAFLGLWAAQDPIADWDQNGTVNTIDFLAFLGDWVAGC